MKSIILLGLLVFSFSSCKKIIEKKQTQMVVDAITNGRWKVTDYQKGADDLTAGFDGYQFQFQSNETVDAIKNNIVEKTGSWKVNTDSATITSNFLNAAEPLSLLNGTWHITNSTWTSVDAYLDLNGETRILKLGKLP